MKVAFLLCQPLVCHVPSAVVTARFHEPRSSSLFSFISRLATSSTIAFTTGYHLDAQYSYPEHFAMSCNTQHECSRHDLHTYTDIIIPARSMLILGKGFKNWQFYFTPVTPKKYREASAQSSAFHSNWNKISITPLGFATPDLIDGINKHTNLGQPHKANPIGYSTVQSKLAPHSQVAYYN